MSSKNFNSFKDFQSDQIQTSSRKLFNAHFASSNSDLNLTLVTGTTNGFTLIESWGVRLTCFDYNGMKSPWQVKICNNWKCSIQFHFKLTIIPCNVKKRNHNMYIIAARNLPFFKLHFSFPFGFSLQGWISEDIFVNDLFVKINIHRVSKMLTKSC